MNQFFKLLSETLDILKRDFLSFVPFLGVYFILNSIPSFFILMERPLEDFAGLFVRLLIAILSIINMVCIVKILLLKREEKIVESWGDLLWEGICDTPSFILYSLLYGLKALGWSLLLIVPGIYFSFMYSLAPLIVILKPNFQGDYFKESKRLVSRGAVPLLLFVVLTLLSSFLYLPTVLIEDSGFRLMYNFFFSIPEGLYSVFADIFFVNLYFHLSRE